MILVHKNWKEELTVLASFQALVVQKMDSTIHQAPVVQKLESAIHRISRYPADKYYENQLRYPQDSDLSAR